jgi:putative nucleotidyltransferase with HDIG domain
MCRSIRFKLSLFVFLLLIFTSLVFSFGTVKILDQTLQNEIIRKAESLAKSSAYVAAYSLISGDELSAARLAFKGKESNPDVEYVAIIDKNMKVRAHSDIKQRGEIFKQNDGNVLKTTEDGMIVREILAPSGKMFEISSPILFANKLLGTCIVGINQSVLLEAQRLARNRIFSVLAIILFVGVAGILGLSYLITKPIQELSIGVGELKEGKTVRPLRVLSNDELGKLTESFNSMSSLITDQKNELLKYTQELEEAYFSVLRVLALAIDARDSYTLGHSTRVALHSVMIGEEIGLSREDLTDLEIASLFHDLGKLKTPDSILFKDKTLNSSEFDRIRHHAEDGAEILRRVKSLQKYVEPVRHHHEYYNGQGYPDKLGGDNIPLHAAIISIADTFDAMTSTRAYRQALSKGEALKELEKRAGEQFHPELVKAFLRVLGNGKKVPSQTYMARVVD